MELKAIPLIEGKPDFSEIRISEITCTEREFAEITGISRAYVNRLKHYGVFELDGGRGSFYNVAEFCFWR